MTRSVRTALLPALAVVALASCGGGGGSPPNPSPGPPPPPGANAPPTFTTPAAISVTENAAGVVYRPFATDPENQPVTITLTGGADAARFGYNQANRELRFIAQPDFEAPADANSDNVYEVQLAASDGTNTTNLALRVTVTNTGNGIRFRRVAAGIAAPIYLTGLPDGSGRIVVVERAGRIRLMDPATGQFAGADFLNVSSEVSTNGEQGLLSIAFSPNFTTDRLFFIHMNNISGDTEIRKYAAPTNEAANPATGDVILRVDQPTATNHKGGTLAFTNNGLLLISLGDGGSNSGTAQDPNQLLGKLLRINPFSDAFPNDANRDYAIPAANPFSGGGGAPEIWAMGLRNPFRFTVDPVTGDILIGEVGENTIEEVDRLPAGQSGPVVNYGWNRREGSQPLNGGASQPGDTLPVTEYLHGSGDRAGSSITGGAVYRGPADGVQGQYFFADFISNNKWSLPLSSLNVGSVLPSSNFTLRNGDFVADLGTINQIVCFCTDEAYNLYIVDIGGEIFRLEPN